MTSSLVGSEMCIRDSFSATCTSSGAVVGMRVIVAFAEELPMEVVSLLAVSYTHLTLPTICSV
eukprot:7164359-Prorocentrum_lima.AAC.1